MKNHFVAGPIFLALLFCIVSDAASPGVQVARDISYATIAGVAPHLLSLDVYAPARPLAKPAPVVVWVHGGGWAVGDKANAMQYKPAFFTSAGYCLVSVNYRLSPERNTNDPNRVRYPVHEQDIAAAVAWVHAHIARYGGDPERIALAGHSSGAHLVALVGTDESFLVARQLPLRAIKAVIALDTEAYDVPAHMQDRPPSEMYLSAFGDDPEVWKRASPRYQVAAGKGIPPFLLVTRGLPERRAFCTDFAAALQNANVSATVLELGGYSHEAVNRQIGAPGETRISTPILQFLATHLKGEAGRR